MGNGQDWGETGARTVSRTKSRRSGFLPAGVLGADTYGHVAFVESL